jgi:hypothetical protein
VFRDVAGERRGVRGQIKVGSEKQTCSTSQPACSAIQPELSVTRVGGDLGRMCVLHYGCCEDLDVLFRLSEK